MDFQTVLDKYSPLLRKHLIPIVLGFAGLIFLGYGLISLIGPRKGNSDITFEPGDVASSSAKMEVKIFVDVEGAVIKPGIQNLASSARMQDALISAGGLSQEANREWVSKNLNLAAKLTDGAKIYIPKAEEAVAASSVSNTTLSVTTSGQININTANEKDLDTLPGVGPVTAQKIISSRPYSSIEDLLNKKVVSSKVFSQIKDKISTY